MDYSVLPLHDIPALIEWLDTLYPDRCPDPKHTEREIWMKAGERRLVCFGSGHLSGYKVSSHSMRAGISCSGKTE